MMYAEKMAVAIKTNGRVLRENKDTVLVPFGSEYSIYIKNLNSVRALVNISIDGQDVAPGGLVVYGNSQIDLERFIKNNNLTEGNRFKFIERTAGVEQHRGIGVEDGLIRIEYQFERVATGYTGVWGPFGHKYGCNYDLVNGSTTTWNSTIGGASAASDTKFNVNGVLRTADMSKGQATLQAASADVKSYCALNNIAGSSASDGDVTATMDWNDAGITVPGSRSEQRFQIVGTFPTETTKHVMVIKLLGETPDNRPVLKPVTVKHKPRCQTCNRQNKAHAKFCVECGTSLEIYA